MKFIATLLSTAAAVSLEGIYDADGNLLAYPRGDGAIQFADGQVGLVGGDRLVGDGLLDTALELAPLGFDTRDMNVFNFYGQVYGDVKGISDAAGRLGLGVTADAALAGLGDTALLGLAGGLDGLDAAGLAAAQQARLDAALAAGVVGADGLALAAGPGLAGGLGGLAGGLGGLGGIGAQGLVLGDADLSLAGLGGAGRQLLDQNGGVLTNLGDGSGTALVTDALGGVGVLVDGGALEGAPAKGSGLGGAAITSAEGGWCGYNATKQASANCAPGLSCVNGLCTDLDAYTSKFELGEASGDRFEAGHDPFVTLNEGAFTKTADGDMVAH